jgi:hypothetical protein
MDPLWVLYGGEGRKVRGVDEIVLIDVILEIVN